MEKDILKSFKDIAEVIENDSSMTLINPVLPKINLVKNGIWVGITRNWLDTDENWIVTGFGEFNKEQELKKEAADAINAVSTKYGYTPEFLSVGKQVGAVISSIENNNIKKSNVKY